MQDIPERVNESLRAEFAIEGQHNVSLHDLRRFEQVLLETTQRIIETNMDSVRREITVFRTEISPAIPAVQSDDPAVNWDYIFVRLPEDFKFKNCKLAVLWDLCFLATRITVEQVQLSPRTKEFKDDSSLLLEVFQT